MILTVVLPFLITYLAFGFVFTLVYSSYKDTPDSRVSDLDFITYGVFWPAFVLRGVWRGFVALIRNLQTLWIGN